MQPQSLHGKIAVVTGASRGVGRGIALVLGEAGATVYVTGRSSRAGQVTVTRDWVGKAYASSTIKETAELVTARGGHTTHPMPISHPANAAARRV